MALKPSVFKMNIQIADMNRHYYNDHLMTIAQHPSENNERLMVRVLAFALNASNSLNFADSISDNNNADLWDRDYNNEILLWVSVGLPDEKLIKKASIKAKQVIIYSYGGRTADMWWDKVNFSKYDNVRVVNLTESDTQALAEIFVRGMKISFTIQEDDVLVTTDTNTLNISINYLK